MITSKFSSGYGGQLNWAQALQILNGQTVSAGLDTGGFTLCGVFIPAAFTGVALTFEACPTAIDGTFVPVVNTLSGVPLSYTVAPGQYLAVDPKDFQGIRFLKLVSGASEGADRTLTLALKGF